MEYQPFQQRVVDEKTELDKRITALVDFIATNNTFLTLDSAEQERLRKQSELMHNYSLVLGARIAAFK